MAKQKKFNITGICIPQLHYMVDTSDKIDEIIRDYIECDEYFTINRARQYGKSTTLELLYNRLTEYLVLDISFEAADDCFTSLHTMVQGIISKISRVLSRSGVPKELAAIWNRPITPELPLDSLSGKITEFCAASKREVILMVDEVDQAADNQVFLSFLGLLREKYLKRSTGRDDTFKNVILAGIYDVKNLQRKLRPGSSVHYNSPWNIAAEFQVDMGFSAEGIEGMLLEYEQDKQTGMDITAMAELIFDYTSGYPFLVSYLCKLLDEKVPGREGFPDEKSAWTQRGLQEAVKELVTGPNTLYDDMIKKVEEYPDLSSMLQNILFRGREYPYHEYNKAMNMGKMLGFISEQAGVAVISTRIFETQLYNYFISEELSKNTDTNDAIPSKNQFIKEGRLDMDLVMRKFYEYYASLYRREDERFTEEYGRKIFLIYLKPIINGKGNFYVEAETRDKTRTDIIVDYGGRQYVIEIKIWHGQEYNKAGEKQLSEYLEHYHLEKGYLLSFCFNKKRKQAGIREVTCGSKEILEVVI